MNYRDVKDKLLSLFEPEKLEGPAVGLSQRAGPRRAKNRLRDEPDAETVAEAANTASS
jgi:hypothetical protein